MEVQRRGAGEVGRLDRAHDRPAAGARLEPDEPLYLEQAEGFPQGTAADGVLLGHRRLERQPRAGSQTEGDDVVHDVEGDPLRCLGSATAVVALDVADGHLGSARGPPRSREFAILRGHFASGSK